MSIEAIASLGANVAAFAPAAAPAAPAVTAGNFESLLGNLSDLNTHMLTDQNAVAGLARGQTDNLHQVMMGMEQTRLAFEVTLAVRNKLLEAYQELMRMQV
jgi:flagellar hook-basal body complex protein FliE